MYLSIGEKAKECGVSVATLRRWDKRGLLKPDIITAGGHRRYKNKNRTDVKRRVIAYARVSSYDQKADLEKQKDVITAGGHRRYKKKNKKMSSLLIIPMCCSLISVPGLILISPDLKN